MVRKAAEFVSVITNPFLMPLFSFFIVIHFDKYLVYFRSPVFYGLYLSLFIFTFLLPISSIFILYLNKAISSMRMGKRRERFLPFFITVFYLGIQYWMFRKSAADFRFNVFYSLLLGAIFTIVVSAIINLRFKISIHMVGVCGIIGAMIALFQNHHYFNFTLISMLILLAGLVGVCRIFVKAHSLTEVLAGALLGSLGMYFFVLEGWYF